MAGPFTDYVGKKYLQQDPDLTTHLGGTDLAHPQSGEIQQYIDQAARARGIDPEVAMNVAYHEGGLTDPAERGTFKTGSSWWPFQLHYGGKGYEQFGNTAGMGNDFTAQTGWQPGDPGAWRDSVDYALDQVLKSPTGWQNKFYGAAAGGVAPFQGLPRGTYTT